MATGDKRKTKVLGNETSFGILKNMTEKDADAYMFSLGDNKVKLEGLEVDIEGKMRKAFQQLGQFTGRMKRLEAEINQTRETLQKLQGEISAYSDLLVSAEDARRGKED